MTTCAVLPVWSALHDRSAVAGLQGTLRPIVAAAGAVCIESVESAPMDLPLAVLVLTGGSETRVLAAWRARQQLVPGEPLLLLTHAEHNSLPAALEALARVQHDGGRGRIVNLEPAPASPNLLTRPHHQGLRAAIHDVAVWHAMHRARIGVVGTPSDWLVASVPDAGAVTRRWGTTLVPTDLAAVVEAFDENIEAPLAEPVRLRSHRHDQEPHPAEIETAARFEPVLQQMVERERFDAITVRCFDLVSGCHTSGCLALSALNDRGIVAGCEGDIAAAMTLLWVRHLVGRMGWMANPAAVHAEQGTIELAHCTVPLSMVDSYELQTHFESGIGVGIAGTLPAGPVTLARLGGDELELLWCADGESLPTAARADRCRTQLDVRIDPAATEALLRHPLGNHLVMIQGHHAAELRAWWQEMIA